MEFKDILNILKCELCLSQLKKFILYLNNDDVFPN